MLYLVCSCSIDVHKGDHWNPGIPRIPMVTRSCISSVVIEAGGSFANYFSDSLL